MNMSRQEKRRTLQIGWKVTFVVCLLHAMPSSAPSLGKERTEKRKRDRENGKNIRKQGANMSVSDESASSFPPPIPLSISNAETYSSRTNTFPHCINPNWLGYFPSYYLAWPCHLPLGRLLTHVCSQILLLAALFQREKLLVNVPTCGEQHVRASYGLLQRHSWKEA